MTTRQYFFAFSTVVPIALLVGATQVPSLHWLWLIVIPIILVGLYDLIQVRKTILRIYPVIGHIRYFFEFIRPEIQQYFVESDLNGVPVPREFRSLIYQRAKKVDDTRPFGTIFDTYLNGYEWVNHSLKPTHFHPDNLRVMFGGKDCTQTYHASLLNISAMSFGSLSKNAILALNKGARIGKFAHNTGEGGISSYHLEHDGDLIWQIGTGYFGCRDEQGNFDPELFIEKSQKPAVKMIEVKLSQGAKPGHGGILPAAKLTTEIAAIRNVPMNQDVVSPAGHSAFSTPKGLINFIGKLRELSGGKPVGFKLCIGEQKQFFAICKAMIETGITPDFITIDGSEGGTGAAPIELTNSVGTPIREGLNLVHNALQGINVRNEIKLIAAGKVFSAFHLLRLLALGADTVNSARGMMFSLGCIQARHCNTDKCPSGVATQDPARYKRLDVVNKAQRVANFHEKTVVALAELLGVMGLSAIKDIQLTSINRRISQNQIVTYADLYPNVNEGCLLQSDTVPRHWRNDWKAADAENW